MGSAPRWMPPDWNILAPAFYGEFGYDRPLYTLAHYGVHHPVGRIVRPPWLLVSPGGYVDRRNRARATFSGGTVDLTALLR